jgi:cell wall-associated NlpC family hydrolase
MKDSANYWIGEAADAGDLLGSEAWIAEFNRLALAHDPHLVNLAAYPSQRAGDEVERLITGLSRPASTALHFPDGKPLTVTDYDRYQASLALGAIPETVTVRFGLVLERTDMRTWPNTDRVFRTPETADLDRFQENGLFPGDAVAILHASADGDWLFVQSYNYSAWVRREAIALAPREAVRAYRDAEPYLVITGAQVDAAFEPPDDAVPDRKLDMGVRLPLADPQRAAADGAFRVRLPVAREGRFAVGTARIAPDADVRVGHLPYTRENLVRQAFKFLGEPYGWGHSLNARDCSGMILEVFKSVGIRLPRNSAQQGGSPIGRTVRFAADTTAGDKLAALAAARPGDLLYADGHVMMFLGCEDGEAWVIHDTSNTGGLDGRAGQVAGGSKGVLVTPLTPAPAPGGETYFETLYAIKTIQ